ncbi:LacI family DNA-binding transcriptional regulator [Mesorhizobium sp. NPDC059054]|uniref:LacI family DNA-binding transcriptional regulator n=1 Tax=Mesorhizobium sp. NPDC059054 TaxID=3346711 RepID=UPI00369FFEBF
MSATIKDVAEAAGVSITTVSHVLNGKGRTGEKTRAAVLAAVERVGYRADPVARSLRTGKTGVLGIVFRPSDAIRGSMSGTEYHIRLAGAAAAAALSRGLGLLHIPELKEGALSALPMDGCIVVAPHRSDPVATLLRQREVPFVFADPEPDDPTFEWSVRRDDYNGVRSLLDHLRGNGAGSISFFCGRDENSWLVEARRACSDWATETGISVRTVLVDEVGGAEAARQAARTELTSPQRPDAIIAATSRFAAGVALTAEDLAIPIPGELMLSTLSDSEIARSHPVPVTALDLHGAAMGREAVALLVRRLEGERLDVPVVIEPTLRERASTARPNSGHALDLE